MLKQLSRLFDSEGKRLRKIIDNAPGPSPWYFRDPKLSLTSNSSNLKWENAGNEHPFSGKSILKTPDNRILLILDFYCYVLQLKQHKFLVWYEETNKTPDKAAFIHLSIIDADKLEPIGDLSAACISMKESNTKVFYKGGTPVHTSIRANIAEGKHEIDLPDEFKEIDELLMLAHMSTNKLGIYSILPRKSVMEVYPQDWFNNGNYDYGYEWVTRMARDDTTQKICGDGMRIGNFVLDSTNRNIEKWL